MAVAVKVGSESAPGEWINDKREAAIAISFSQSYCLRLSAPIVPHVQDGIAASLSGTIVDPTGAVIPDVVVAFKI